VKSSDRQPKQSNIVQPAATPENTSSNSDSLQLPLHSLKDDRSHPNSRINTIQALHNYSGVVQAKFGSDLQKARGLIVIKLKEALGKMGVEAAEFEAKTATVTQILDRLEKDEKEYNDIAELADVVKSQIAQPEARVGVGELQNLKLRFYDSQWDQEIRVWKDGDDWKFWTKYNREIGAEDSKSGAAASGKTEAQGDDATVRVKDNGEVHIIFEDNWHEYQITCNHLSLVITTAQYTDPNNDNAYTDIKSITMSKFN